MESNQLMPSVSQQDARQGYSRTNRDRTTARKDDSEEAGDTLDEMREEYHSGYPSEIGWYDVLVNGREERLLHRICHQDNRHEWKDIHGIRIDDEVLWTGEATVTP